MSAHQQTHPSYGSMSSSRPTSHAQLEVLLKSLECLKSAQDLYRQKINNFEVLRDLEKKMTKLHTDIKTILLEIRRNILVLRNHHDPNGQSQADQLESQLFQAEEKYQQQNAQHRRMLLQRLPETETHREQSTDAEAIEFQTDAGPHEADEQFINDRAEGMKQLEQDMLLLNEMFNDLAVTIHQQGFVIDNIESNMTVIETHTGHAVEELQEAKKYQNKSRKKLFCICFWLLLVLAVIILVAVTTTKH